jgi:hypothetical protein
MTYFKDEYENVYDDDDLVDYIENNAFDEDAFESYLNDTEDTVTICGRDYDPGDVLRNAYPFDFDMEYKNKLEELASEFRDRLEPAVIGDNVEVCCDTYVTVCDEDGNTSTKPVKNILLPADYTIEGEEDKVLRFKTEDEEERFVIELPIAIAKESAKKILF